jgi:predicted XRE-type DNA-binding protein
MPKTSDLSPRKKGQVHVSLENSDLSQSEIARRLEIHRSSVCRKESGNLRHVEQQARRTVP